MELPKWYAVQSATKSEKRVLEHLTLRGIEALLPTYVAVRRWKNRTTNTLELPLFPGYLFVRTRLSDRIRILQTPNIISFVGLGPQPIPIEDAEVDLLANRISRFDPMPYPNMQIGDKVRVKSGPLTGAVGVLVRRKSNLRLVICMNLIMQSVSVDVEAADIEPLVSKCGQVVPRVVYVPPRSAATQNLA